MPVSVRRVPDEPILIATVSGLVDVPAILELFRRSDELIRPGETRIFRMTDVRDATATFAETMATIQAAGSGHPGSTTDPRIQTVFLGSNQWIQMFRTALQLEQFGGVNLPMFMTEEDAMTYIRTELQKEQD